MSKIKNILELVAKAAQAFLDFEKKDRSNKQEAEQIFKKIMSDTQKKEILSTLKKIEEM